MSFDFKSLSSTPLSPKERIESNNVLKPSNGGFDFNALPKTPIELAAQHIYQYGSYTPESFGLGVRQEQQPTTQWGIGVTPKYGVSMKTAQTTPKIGEGVPPPKSYFEGLADTIDAITEQGQKASEQYKRGEINAATKYSGDVANITSIAVAPIGEFINQIPVVSGIMKVMSEGLQFGPKGAGEALSNVPGYKQILEKNPWISDYSEAITPTVENATVTAMNLGMLVGTIESTARIVKGGNEALQYRVRKDADGNLVTRNPDGDVIYIEDKTGQTKYGEKPANYPLIRINSVVQDIRESAPQVVENGKVTKNAGTIKEIITGTKSGQNWWAQNAEADAASQRVAAKVDLSTSIDTTGTVNTKPQQEYFRQTYLDKTESVGYDLLAKEDASVNLERVINKLKEEFGNTNLPQSIVEKAVNATVKKLLTTADELGNIKLLELAKEKSAAQRSANYERTQNNTNNEIKNKTVGRALRLVVEETSKTDVAKVNGELSKLYQELAVLERLDTMKVSGGKLGKYFAQISGNIVGGLAGGAIGGPVGAAASAVVGGELASALRGKIMAGKFKKTTPSGETSATISKAIKDVTKTKTIDLKTPDKKVGAPKSVKKTKEIVTLEGKIAKNVEAQKVAIKAKDYTLVAKLKSVYQELVTQLKKAIKAYKEMTPQEKQSGHVNWGADLPQKPSAVMSGGGKDVAIDERLAPLADKEGMITVYRASSTHPKDVYTQGTFFATQEKNARYYAESWYKGNPSDIQVKAVKMPASLLKRGGSSDAWQLKEDFKIPTGKEDVSAQSAGTSGGFSDLEAEAKKYKSAEEFVDSPRFEYHLSNEKNLKSGEVVTTNNPEGVYTSKNPDAWKVQLDYERGKIAPQQLYLVEVANPSDKTINLLQNGKIVKTHESISKVGDVKVISKLGTADMSIEEIKKITKSQLTDIWKKANKKD